MTVMDVIEAVVWTGFAHCVLDFVLGIVLGRCVTPWLRCPACQEHGRHG